MAEARENESRVNGSNGVDATKGKDAKGRFTFGNPGGPGYRKSGRTVALEVLDELLGETKNVTKLRNALQGRFDDDPAAFFSAFVMPLLPKESLVKLETHASAPIRILGPIDPLPTEPEPSDA